MTESFLRSDLPSMRAKASAGGEAFQSAPALSPVGARGRLCASVCGLRNEPSQIDSAWR